MSPVISGNIDVALLVFYAFVLFFIGLVIHLNRESRREGFPLEDDDGRLHSLSLISDASPKVFRLPFGRGTRSTADYARDAVNQPGQRDSSPGSPLYPTGNPLVDGIGPAAYADRAKVPDLDIEGTPRIVPLSTTDAIWIDKRDPDPRGMKVVGADGAVAGTVNDIWVDKADRLIRYLSVDTGARTVLAPMTMAKIVRGQVVVDAINAAQFAEVPGLAESAVITLYEEERIIAYFGGGYLYANRARQEPWL